MLKWPAWGAADPYATPACPRASGCSPSMSRRTTSRASSRSTPLAPSIGADIGQDGVDVLHQLQPLEQVGARQPHALADQFEEIDHLERPVAFVAAQLAMAGVIDAGERRHAGGLGGLELAL